MQNAQFEWRAGAGFSGLPSYDFNPDFVVFFACREALGNGAFDALRHVFPRTQLLGCSTGGQFDRMTIEDDRLVGVAVKFENASCRLASTVLDPALGSMPCGEALGAQLTAADLKGVFILSDGLSVNGSELVAGISKAVGDGVSISGGLAGDGARFEQTLVSANCVPRSGLVAAIGFYGESLEIGTGSAGGWDAFGPRRAITKSAGNVLHELDGKPALELYKRYLSAEELEGLPGSALLFPLRISDPTTGGRDVVRTILAVDHEAGTMTFAGDMPDGWQAQLMRGNFDRLTDGASHAARQAGSSDELNGFSILVSCIGRRLLMGQRAIDEVEAAANEISAKQALLGFYSYGEISPHAESGFCQLHNQTMTVMSVRELSSPLRV